MVSWMWMACAPMEADAPVERGGGNDAVEMGLEAPDFTLEGVDGAPITLSHDRGKVIFLDMSGFT